jgi:anaerobic magnesium-protoporphyrin IX monomethyl ester cyclase
MSRVLLIYPYFSPRRDRSLFRFPPLGVAYVAAALREAGHDVRLLDCTFMDREEALSVALAVRADVVGISCLVTLLDECLWFAERLRDRTRLLVAGGPLPTCEPDTFLGRFDFVVRGEGEETMRELVAVHQAGGDPGTVAGAVSRAAHVAGDRTTDADGSTAVGAPRPFAADLDALPFPARDLLPNRSYIGHGRRRYGHAVTTVMSTRGCPYDCEFCSNVVFGPTYRERSPGNVVDEIEEALAFGYDRISFADDVFTLNRRRVIAICAEITRRRLRFSWECLGRVDSLDFETARTMRAAGCDRIFFGIESGNDEILALMNKGITTDQARSAVEAARRAGITVGAFFILFYPGETDDTVLDTLRFAGSLPLDYLGLTMPYPLPGTALLERIGTRRARPWRQQGGLLLDHTLTFDADVSATKMRFALLKGHAQFRLRNRLGDASPLLRAFESSTDGLLRLLR